MKLFNIALPRIVIVFGVVSLLNDMASDMIAPLLPIFLTATLGAGPAIVGIIEGVAEATASLVKLASGWLADRGYNAKKMVIAGYSLSNIARPLIALAIGWWWILLLRFFDRIGKGIRTAPRDAMISQSVPSELRGKAFGLHRTMDHTGAMIGPLIAFFLLQAGYETRDVFLFSVIPGVLVILILMFGVPKNAEYITSNEKPRFNWRELDPRLRSLIIAAGILALATAPEAFIVLWATHNGLEIVWVPLLWAFAHLIKAGVAMPAGMLSDRLGRKPVMIIGWVFRFVFLLLFTFTTQNTVVVWILFTLFAASTAFTEGAERALIGDLAPKAQKATAFGLYHLISGIFLLPGAILFGVLWEGINMPTAFATAAVLTAIGAVLFLRSAKKAELQA